MRDSWRGRSTSQLSRDRNLERDTSQAQIGSFSLYAIAHFLYFGHQMKNPRVSATTRVDCRTKNSRSPVTVLWVVLTTYKITFKLKDTW